MSVINVRISLSDAKFNPSPDPITLSKKAGNTIKWYNDTNEQITISFGPESPFSKKTPYVIEAGKHADSGAIDAAPETKWKYTISGGKIVTDPDVIIKP